MIQSNTTSPSSSAQKLQQQHIAFIHPDLGIGGAQQLIVNLCLAAKKYSYQPHIYTPYHHKSFPETHDGTITIHEHGSFFGLIPDTIFGMGKGLLAYIRSWVCCLYLIAYTHLNYKVVVADQVSIVLPLLWMFGYKTIFYCHYPDKLLAGKRRNPLKRLYRFIIDLAEQISLLFAHKIYVNSQFTKTVFYENFRILKQRKVKVEILYPALDFSQFDQQIKQQESWMPQIKEKLKGQKYFFSLNRYERKKNINLAIQAFSDLINQNPLISGNINLVIAGGYDPKVVENIEHAEQLKQLANELNISNRVIFLFSIPNGMRKYLLKNALCVLYTPQNEHFGIVPCQAMYCSVPVIAENSGGPKQSVGQGCGYLCDGGRVDWKNNMIKVLIPEQMKKLNKGKQRMIARFGLDMFAKQFVTQGIENLIKNDKN